MGSSRIYEPGTMYERMNEAAALKRSSVEPRERIDVIDVEFEDVGTINRPALTSLNQKDGEKQ